MLVLVLLLTGRIPITANTGEVNCTLRWLQGSFDYYQEMDRVGCFRSSFPLAAIRTHTRQAVTPAPCLGNSPCVQSISYIGH
jgi:hypothetical protein